MGYLSYDTVRRLERLPDGNVDDLAIPELSFLLASDLAVLDQHTNEVWLIANAINFDDTDERVDEAYADAVARVEEMTALLAEPTPSAVVSAQFDQIPADPPPAHPGAVPVGGRGGGRGDQGRRGVPDRGQPAVRGGHHRRRAGHLPGAAAAQPEPLHVPAPADRQRRRAFDIVGSSPEALVTVKGDTAITHPIAGSKPRGATPAEDAALETELLADPKERAEHVMLVDLGRNDLGRVCRPGTVEVVEFMEVRRYSHIMHLESTVTGTIAADRSALDVVLAAFPAGTLSGAPKVRAMEIIDELEVSRRGLYGGVVGYLDFAGDADAAIAIRTALLRNGVAYVQAGGGIVADSDPATEDQESQNKAAAVVRAVSVAQSFPGRCVRDAAGSLAFALLLAGAGLALVAGSQPWSRATSGPVSVAFTGNQVTGGLTQTLALTVLAGTLLMLVLRVRGRRVVGALLGLLGLGLVLVGAAPAGAERDPGPAAGARHQPARPVVLRSTGLAVGVRRRRGSGARRGRADRAAQRAVARTDRSVPARRGAGQGRQPGRSRRPVEGHGRRSGPHDGASGPVDQERDTSGPFDARRPRCA